MLGGKKQRSAWIGDFVLELPDFVCWSCQHETSPCERFCSRCCAELPAYDLTGPTTTYDEPIEFALRHTLADVYDGHLGLWGVREAFTRTGEILVDRQVTSRLAGVPWIVDMLRRGWIAPDRGGRSGLVPAQDRLVATHEAWRVLKEAGLIR